MKHTEKFRSFPAGIAFLALLFLFLSCDSGSDGDEPGDINSAGFEIDVSGNISRDMKGTNALYRFNEMPSSFVTTHQLAIYLSDGDGYTVTATILINGASLPAAGTYNVPDFLTSTGLQEFDAGLMFGQNGGSSYNTTGGGGRITITETGSDYVKGTLTGSLGATGGGSGSVNLSGSFYAEFFQ